MTNLFTRGLRSALPGACGLAAESPDAPRDGASSADVTTADAAVDDDVTEASDDVVDEEDTTTEDAETDA